MNKKSQLIMLKIMLAILVLIVAMIFTQPLKESINIGTNSSSNLNCSASDLSAETNATCIIMDQGLFYFLGIILSIGMAFVAGKRNVSGVVTAIVTFVIVHILISPLTTLIIYARDVDHLNCAASTISTAARMTCILLDVWLFWFVIAVISAAITFMFAKKVLPK
jgi:hypothetical protein